MKFRHKIQAAVLGLVLCAALLAGCGKGTIDSAAVAATVNGEEIPLGMFSFYTRYQQASIYSTMLATFGMSDFFDSTIDDEEDADYGKTYGETLKNTAIKEIEDLMILRSHAGDYGISLTDEEKAEIADIAEAFFSSNSEEIVNKIGATKEQVTELMELLKIKEKIHVPMGEDVDTDVDTAEAQQSSLTYSRIARNDKPEADADGNFPADESSQEYRDAQTFLDNMLALDDPASADMAELADEVNEDFGTASGAWTTNDPSDTYLNEVLMESVEGLADGQMVDHVVVTEDAYYVVRMDLEYDETRTGTKINSIVSERRREAYTELLDSWREAAEITENADVLAKIVVTDQAPYVMDMSGLTE